MFSLKKTILSKWQVHIKADKLGHMGKDSIKSAVPRNNDGKIMFYLRFQNGSETLKSLIEKYGR